MRDTKILDKFTKDSQKKWKEMQLFINLKKEVNHGANGTKEYVIKKGINKGKIAKWILQNYLKKTLYSYQ